MREQSFIYFKKSLLIVHKQVQEVTFVSKSEIWDFDSILCQLSQSKETLFEFPRFLWVLFYLLELLLIVYLILKPHLHNVLSYFLDSVHKETLQFILLRRHINLVWLLLPQLVLLSFYLNLQFLYSLRVICFQSLHILLYFLFNLVQFHLRLEDKVKEFAELDVLSGNVAVLASWTPSHYSLWLVLSAHCQGCTELRISWFDNARWRCRSIYELTSVETLPHCIFSSYCIPSQAIRLQYLWHLALILCQEHLNIPFSA